ncbi:MAG: Protein phosphatase PrpC [Eubacteriales bacterium SKADARSKE-1]|nr:Protein phosphatase PrpC [Eubacteriales bacterium SKADARSKE-1]
MKIYGKTDTGVVRKTNQDSFNFGVINESFVWAVVCDGVGGNNSGDVASHLATEVVQKKINDVYRENMTDDEIKSLLSSCIEFASSEIFNKSNEKQEYFGMRTTIVLVAVRNDIIHVAHVGDSRAYLISENSIKQLTVDHSIVQELVKKGEITTEEAKNHPKKNIITRSLGAQSDVEVDYVQQNFPKDSAILVCTDGLSNYMEKQELLNYFKDLEGQQLVDSLINYANDMGGNDNITALVITR